MKPITLCFALTLTAVLGAAIADPVLVDPEYPVRDEDGNPVETDVDYYVLPFTSGKGKGGGLILKSRPYRDLPDVVQSSNDSDTGYLVKFQSSSSNVQTSENIQIDIRDPQPADPVTLYWRLDDFDPEFKETFVTTTEFDNAGDSPKSIFQIVEVIKGRWGRYKLVSPAQVGSVNIGIFTDKDQIRRLAINDKDPYEVKFKKAPPPKKFIRPFIAL